jgi:hypothetical protein
MQEILQKLLKLRKEVVPPYGRVGPGDYYQEIYYDPYDNPFEFADPDSAVHVNFSEYTPLSTI